MNTETIAIIGASDLGRKWAYRSLSAGYRTILEDVSISVLERGVGAIRAMWEAGTSRDARDSARAAAGQLVTARSVEEAVREADLIVETVSDEFEMKLELFTIFDKFGKPGAILASTTNTISITDLAEMTFCPERCIGMRFAGEPGAERLELMKGRWTSEETVVRCREVARRMGLEIRLAPDAQEMSAGGGS